MTAYRDVDEILEQVGGAIDFQGGTYEAMPIADNLAFKTGTKREGYIRVFAQMHQCEPADVTVQFGDTLVGQPIVRARIILPPPTPSRCALPHAGPGVYAPPAIQSVPENTPVEDA